jgi:septation ring formation regulator EzrA
VPDKIKTRIALIFEALPHKTRAKRKVPFQRLTTPEQNAKARDKLLARTRKEIETLERKQEMNSTEVGQATLERMREALKIIARLTDTEHIPATWSGVL